MPAAVAPRYCIAFAQHASRRHLCVSCHNGSALGLLSTAERSIGRVAARSGVHMWGRVNSTNRQHTLVSATVWAEAVFADERWGLWCAHVVHGDVGSCGLVQNDDSVIAGRRPCRRRDGARGCRGSGSDAGSWLGCTCPAVRTRAGGCVSCCVSQGARAWRQRCAYVRAGVPVCVRVCVGLQQLWEGRGYEDEVAT